MSIKRISRRRVAAPYAEYVDQKPLTTIAGGPDDARVGADVETKASVPTNRAVVPTNKTVSSDIESKVGTKVDTRDGSYSKWSV